MRVATAEFSDGSKGPILIVDDRYVDLREYGFNDVRAVLESMTVDPHEILRIGEKADGTHELKLVKIKAPIERPGKLLCLGLNYLDHARELGFEIPREPIVFAKAPTA
ncbi:MAG: fumarylacetoacetate hydrolase family protein, partial [Candidatus Nezhaarchaeales archaeon]